MSFITQHPYIQQKVSKPRALLFSKNKKVPLLWQVLSNKYEKDIAFGSLYDEKRKASSFMGFEADEKKSSTVVVYPVGSNSPVLYDGSIRLFLPTMPLPNNVRMQG